MKHYDITIVGGGPSGIALALMLENTGKRILLVERENTLGGCWRVEWQNEKYYTEHSPHIMTSNYKRFMQLCKYLNVKNEFKNTYKYKSSFRSVYLDKNVIGNLKFSDIIKIVSGLIMSRFIENKQTVDEFCDHISDTGKKVMYILSVAAASTPDKVMMQDMFDIMTEYPPSIIQMSEPELWLNAAKKYFDNSDNIDLSLNTEIKSINYMKNGYTINDVIHTDEVILALPPIALKNILEKSSADIQNNWLPYPDFKLWADESSYNSIGFQLHFDQNVEYKDEWCWSCIGDWNIIILPMSKYLKTFTKDPSVKTVWSCTIIDQNKFSSRLKKKVHQCTLVEIEEEIKHQLNIPINIRVTFYDGLEKSKEQYESKDTGFVRQKYGVLPYTGKLKNIHIVSTVNQKGIITMEKALESAYEFIKLNYNGHHRILDDKNNNILYSVIILILLTIVLYKCFKS